MRAWMPLATDLCGQNNDLAASPQILSDLGGPYMLTRRLAVLGCCSVLASWVVVFAPARTPAEIIDRLDSEVKAALTVPSVRENYAALGLSPVGSSPAEFKSFLAEQVRAYAELVKIAKIEPQ